MNNTENIKESYEIKNDIQEIHNYIHKEQSWEEILEAIKDFKPVGEVMNYA